MESLRLSVTQKVPLERTDALSGKNRGDFMNSISSLFLLFIDKEIVGSKDNIEEYNLIIKIFEEKPLGTVLGQHLKEELFKIIGTESDVLDDNKLIKSMQLCSDVFLIYRRSKGINHTYLSSNNIDDSPINYGTKKFIKEELGYENLDLPGNFGSILSDSIFLFFDRDLFDLLFQKTEEFKKEKNKQKNNIIMMGHLNDALDIIIRCINEQFTEDNKNKNDLLAVIQHIYGIKQTPYSDNMKQKYLDFIGFISDISKDQTLDNKADRYIDALGYYFGDIVPNLDIRYLFIAGEVTFVHKNNFAFTNTDNLINNNEVEEVTNFLSTNNNNYTSDYEKRIDKVILFNSKGIRLKKFDFFKDSDLSAVQGPYFGFIEEELMFYLNLLPENSGITKSKSSNPYSEEFNLDGKYVQYRASFKIENGQFIKNHFLPFDY